MWWYKMFGFVKKSDCCGNDIFYLYCIGIDLMTNKEFEIRPQVININSDIPFFYPYSIQVNKCCGSGNNIKHPYWKKCCWKHKRQSI